MRDYQFLILKGKGIRIYAVAAFVYQNHLRDVNIAIKSSLRSTILAVEINRA